MNENQTPIMGRRASDQWSMGPQNEREAILLTAQAVGRIEEMVKTFHNEVVALKAEVVGLQKDKASVWGAIWLLRVVLVPIIAGLVVAVLKPGLGIP